MGHNRSYEDTRADALDGGSRVEGPDFGHHRASCSGRFWIGRCKQGCDAHSVSVEDSIESYFTCTSIVTFCRVLSYIKGGDLEPCSKFTRSDMELLECREDKNINSS